MGLECKCFFFAAIKRHFAAAFLPEWWAVDFLVDIYVLIYACACEQTVGVCLHANATHFESNPVLARSTWSNTGVIFAPKPWYPLPPSHKQQSDIFMSVPGPMETCLSLSSLAFPFQDTVFMAAVNVQKPSFVIDRVHFDLDSQQGLSSGPVGPCSVHFTQLSLNPVRGIGFGRSGISLGFTI